MFQQDVMRKISSKDPVIEGVDIKLVPEKFGEFLPFVLLDDHFTRAKALDQLVNIFE